MIAETTCSSVVASASKLAGGPAEAEDDDPVGDLEDVDQVVADHDDAQAALAQAPDQLQHLGGLRDAERRGRLVEQHDPGLAEQRARHRDLLALTAGERADLAAQARDRHRQAGEQLLGLVLHPRLVELARDLTRARRDLLAAEEEVGDDVEVVAEGEVLVDGGDPERGGVLGPGDRDLLAAEADAAGVGEWIPAIVFTRVDLPAPLSPTRPTTSPAWTAKSTRSRAWTGPNLLLTPSTSSNGASALIPSLR